MTISTTDLRIFQSQRNRDTADGGGAMSPNEVIDGELNNVFDDISSEDRVTGRVSIRKIFPGVFSDDTERFYGAGLLIIAPALDPAVDVLMTRVTAYDDERADVVGRVETYQVPAASLQWRLFNDHLAGTASLTLFAPSQAPTPDLGDTLFLERAAPFQREAVRVASIVSRSEQTFYDSSPFQRDVMVLELTRPLQNDWEGTPPQRSTTSNPPTLIRDSTVSSGAEYYGVKEITEDIAPGDLTVKIPTPFSRIVPSTNAEVPTTDERVSAAGISYVAAGDADAIQISTGSVSMESGVDRTIHLGGTVLPGSVEISGTFSATDNGDGTFDGGGSGTTVTIDYETGAVTINRDSGSSINLTLTATPGAAIQDSTLTIQVPVTEQTRRLNYIRTLRPLPAPGTVAVDYRALNNWYRLHDNALGSLAGAQPGQGGGSVDYGTGTVTATLAALPDLGTAIIISWGTPQVVTSGSDTINIDRPHFAFTIPQSPMVPGSLAMSYPSDGDTVDLTTNANGDILDGATVIGVASFNDGSVAFRPLTGRWPDGGSQIAWSADIDNGHQEILQPTPSGGSDQVTFTLANAPLEPGSVDLTWLVEATIDGRLRVLEMRAFDDGQGGLVYSNGAAIPGSTINYTTGEVTFPAAFQVS